MVCGGRTCYCSEMSQCFGRPQHRGVAAVNIAQRSDDQLKCAVLQQ
jgi:hypothetical protein